LGRTPLGVHPRINALVVTLRPVAGLYVHVPFRRAARSTADSPHIVTDAPDVDRFETALCRELQYYTQDYADDEPIKTIYAGGGRPSLLPLSTVHAVLTTLLDLFDLDPVEEVTVEVNPADATPRYVHGLKRQGVDRLSLPVQSFFPSVLQSIDAPHTADQAARTLELAREAGFETFSIDLLFGVPHQSLDTWETTLHQAVDMNAPHVTITEMPDSNGDDDARADQLELAMRFLQSGHRSAHQENYYAHGNYLGVGPSAVSFWWPDRTAPRARRWTNVSDLNRYTELLRGRYPPVSYRQTLDQMALAREYILLRLRSHAGLDLNRLNEQYGMNLWALKKDLLDRLCDENLLQQEENTVSLTPEGRLLTDTITERLLPTTQRPNP